MGTGLASGSSKNSKIPKARSRSSVASRRVGRDFQIVCNNPNDSLTGKIAVHPTLARSWSSTRLHEYVPSHVVCVPFVISICLLIQWCECKHGLILNLSTSFAYT